MRTIVLGAALAAVSSGAGATPPAAIAEALASAGGAKTGIAEHAANYGAWPAAADANIVGAPTSYAGTYVARLDLRSSALVEVTLNAATGGGHIRLRPQNPDPWHQPIAWACESPDIADIGQQAGCAYTGVPFGPEVAATAAGPKTAVVEYRMNYEAWPAAADPGIVDAPTSYAGTYVARLDLAANGVLHITLKPSAGGGHVALTPSAAGWTVTWACTSPDIANIASVLAGCTYAP